MRSKPKLLRLSTSPSSEALISVERQIVPAFFLSSLHVPAEDGEDDAGVAHDGEERDGAEAGRVEWGGGRAFMAAAEVV